MSKSFQKTREVALDRAGNECAFCGVTNEQHRQDTGRGLDVHHLLPRSAGGSNDPANLLAVCIGCHRTLEHSQAAAMKEIREQTLEDSGPTVSELEEQNDELRETLSDLIERVHQLERRNRDVGYYKKLLFFLSVDAEIVSQQVGTGVYSTTDSEKARERYEEWGSAIKRTSLSIHESDIERKFDRIQDQLEMIERLGYEDGGQ